MSMGSGGPISSVCRVRDSVSHVCYRIFDIIYQFSKLVFGLILHDILLTKGRIVFLTDYLTSSSKRIWGRKKKSEPSRYFYELFGTQLSVHFLESI